VELTGPWEVHFSTAWGGPETAVFDNLMDWSQHSQDQIKYYSGKATYRKTLESPGHLADTKAQVVLDLGEARDLATVRLNGKTIATLWHAPWTEDITSELRPGPNTLEIDIVNAWNNRLVGDAKLPIDQRRTFLLAPTVKSDAPLISAGLLGPVTLRMSVPVQAK
jgi:hypothetical protein